MNDIIIRNATIDDLEALLGFEKEIIKQERPLDPTIRQGEIHYYDLRKLIQSNDAAVVVAVHKNSPIASGFALIKEARSYLNHKQFAYLGFMYTKPEFRGRGINKKIVKNLYEWATSRGLSEVRLTVYEDNLMAIKAYEKAGFKKHLIEMRLVEPKDI
ncbi:GNAT family N-acetyltransferase [Pareuzebyella sediminis]|nr:GNAT family N-acetyltransferase [Pareuzebyella sediminis]